MNERADYGYDAPYALIAFAVLGSVCAIAAIAAALTRQMPLVRMFGLYGVFFLGNAASFFYTTRRGKFQVWEKVLEGVALKGNERVLDMGCGRGAVLNLVAKRLTTGSVTGIDLWSTHDQSGNSRETTLQNAAHEGVQDRIDVRTGDMRNLPFADNTFDMVVSSLAIHNIRTNEGRLKAIDEAWRVLRPGGRLLIADIRATSRYATELQRVGATDVARRGLGWRFWYGNPIAGTSLVTASKPARATLAR